VRRLTFATLACALLTPLLAAAPAAAAPARQISYLHWDVPAAQATLPAGVRSRSWTTPWAKPGFALTRLVASWEARTPGDSRVRIQVRGRAGSVTSSWDTLGVWAQGDRFFKRTTKGEQADDLGSVSVDTWIVPDGVTSYQLRVTLVRRAGQKASPRIESVGAMASLLPSVSSVKTSHPGVARGVVLDVPAYSQMIHRGHSPEYGAGGEAWCSPTSTSMVLGYYDALPAASAYSWVGAGHADPWVDHVARMTYDYAYEGTGNWPFNTAYAATRVDRALVTRLRSLREAEVLVKAGIPVIASIAFDAGELAGAPITSTAGHLLVIVGFTDDGDVVVNDPAAATDAEVRRTYDRGEFENAWIPTSGGTVYVIADDAHPLPKSAGNW
jgi:peptidase C39-like protein